MLALIIYLRLSLCAVFAVAGVTKLLDLSGTRDALKNFGSPASLIPALSLLLPILELTIAAGLLVDRTTSMAALGALLLLGLFIVAISINLAQGRTHDCHCFGQLHSRPLGWPTLLRNFIFATAAAVLLWQSFTRPMPSLIQAIAMLGTLEWLLLIVGIIAVGGALFGFDFDFRRQGKLDEAASAAQKIAGLPVNTVAPEFELKAYHGGTTSLAQLIAHGKPVLLIFTSPTCGPCVVLFQEIKEWQRTHSEQLTIGLISKGTIKDNFVNVARNDLGEVLLQEEREVAEQYNARVTPTAVVVDLNGHIASPLAAGADEIRSLLHIALEQSAVSAESDSK